MPVNKRFPALAEAHLLCDRSVDVITLCRPSINLMVSDDIFIGRTALLIIGVIVTDTFLAVSQVIFE